MSDPVLVAVIASIPPTLVAIVTLIVALRGAKKVEAVHKATNSMHDAMIVLTDREAHARGVREERARSDASPTQETP